MVRLAAAFTSDAEAAVTAATAHRVMKGAAQRSVPVMESGFGPTGGEAHWGRGAMNHLLRWGGVRVPASQSWPVRPPLRVSQF